MSAITFSEEHYTAIKNAADADGVPVDEWVVTHLPLDLDAQNPAETPAVSPEKPARTMADVLAGRVGLFDSGDNGMLSERHSELFAAHLAGEYGAVQPEAVGAGTVKPRNMAERLAGRLGTLSGSGGLPSSDNVAQSFAEHLEAKQREGTL
jgi:hypothetical protein